MRVRVGVLAVALIAAVAVPARSASPPAQLVLSPEGNHLWAYDAETGDAQLVVRAVNGDDPGVEPNSAERRDINGQVCVSPDGEHVVTGEDTVTGDGGSHDPTIAGWGWFDATYEDGKLSLTQTGKLSPEDGAGPGYRGDPDNYGCGFLGADRLVTTAIGNTLPGDPANGQLFLWIGKVHCEIAGDLATAGGIAVDDNGDVYVATNRPDDANNPGGVWRFSGEWPTKAKDCTPEYVRTHITRTLVIPNRPAAVPLVPDARAATPSAVAISPDDTLYVSSVFTGTVSEYTKGGRWVRDIYPTSPVAAMTGPTSNTPYGLAFTARGDLWIADLGIVLATPAPGQGSVIRVAFDGAGNPVVPATTVAEGLEFPDGLGVYTVPS
jgi:hypothetical protein